MSKTSSSQKRTNESSSLSSSSKRTKPTSAAFAIANVSKYFVLPTSKIQLIIPEKKYEGESTDWATLSCIGVVCKDWNREMNLVSYDTIIRTSLSNFIHDNDQQQTTNRPSNRCSLNCTNQFTKYWWTKIDWSYLMRQNYVSFHRLYRALYEFSRIDISR